MFSWFIKWTKFDIRQMKHELEICGLRIFNFALVLSFFLLLRILPTYQWVIFTDSDILKSAVAIKFCYLFVIVNSAC